MDYNHLMKLSDDMKNLVQLNTEYSQMFNLLGITMNEIIKQIRVTLENIKASPKNQDIQLDGNNLQKATIVKWFEKVWGEGPELQKLKKEPISGAQCNEKTLSALGITNYFKKESQFEYCNNQLKKIRNKDLAKIVESEVNMILTIFDSSIFPKKFSVNQSGGTYKDEL